MLRFVKNPLLVWLLSLVLVVSGVIPVGFMRDGTASVQGRITIKICSSYSHAKADIDKDANKTKNKMLGACPFAMPYNPLPPVDTVLIAPQQFFVATTAVQATDDTPRARAMGGISARGPPALT